MQNFTKIINPTYFTTNDSKQTYQNFIEIEFVGGSLSLHGVMGPFKNGNCKGSCGQCIDTICNLEHEYYNNQLNKGWSKEMLDKLVKIWDEWHLNAMKAYSPAMKEAGWDKIAKTEILSMDIELDDETYKKQRNIKDKVEKNLKENGKAEISEEEQQILNLPLFDEIYTYPDDEFKIPKYYKPQNIDKSSGLPIVEMVTLGWIYPTESGERRTHPDGLLTKVFEPTGEKYGSKWYFHEVPEDILEWLYNLPDSKRQPTWI